MLSQNSERYKEILNYTVTRPDYDANKDQKLFDEYMTQFKEEIDEQDKFKSQDDDKFEFEDSLYTIANEASNQEENDDIYYKGDRYKEYISKSLICKEYISKSLICVGDFTSTNWLLDLRKTFYSETGKLQLELS